MNLLTLLFVALRLCGDAYAAELDVHRAEIAEIGKKTNKFERRIADLQKRKMQAREGEELEAVLTEIGDVHKELLGLRSERTLLKQHLLTEHPDNNLIYDPTLYKTFDKKTNAQKTPLDDRLDELLNLMQTQYAKYLPKKIKEEPVAIPIEVEKKPETPKIVEKAPSATVEVKQKYLHEQIQTEMKIGASPESGDKKHEPTKKADVHKPAKPVHEEKAKPSGHH
jgi:uncharacterized protein (DUF342 family)